MNVASNAMTAEIANDLETALPCSPLDGATDVAQRLTRPRLRHAILQRETRGTQQRACLR